MSEPVYPQYGDYPLYDKNSGRHYRMVGGHIMEYEPTISTSIGEIPISRLKEVNEKIKKSKEEALKKSLAEAQSSKVCPFKGNSARRLCAKDCAWWNGSGCAIGEKDMNELKGVCPISQRNCVENCALRKDNRCDLLKNIVCG